MRRHKNLRFLGAVTIAVSTLAFGNLVLTASAASTPSNTISFAEIAGATPNYIFPYMACQYFTNQNRGDFQYLTYRPAYWFGTPDSNAIDYSLSPANAPLFSHANKTVTVNMKGWKFADGQSVDAESVMFFLNMYKANPTAYCGYDAGYGIPDQVKSASGSGNTVTINFTTSVNPRWILDNYLSEITPLPNVWDVTSASTTSTCASGPFGTKSTDRACRAVERYLDAQATEVNTFASTFWTSGADGPWELSAIDELGSATFVPNPSYSGPVKAQPGIQYVKEVPFATSDAEQSALEDGSLDVGYVDPTTLASNAPSPGVAGKNWPVIASKFNLVSGPLWAFDYTVLNFNKKNPMSSVIAQLYVRQALQEAIDQSGIIRSVDKGYAFAMDSPLPPKTPRSLSGLATTSGVKSPYPFNLKAAKTLLTSHGWTRNASKVMVCTSPGTGSRNCGAGVTKGTTLSFTIAWSSGESSTDDTFNAEIADWSSIGFSFTSSEENINELIADCEAGVKFELCSWPNTWGYDPDVYPSGETLFAPHGGFNVGAYMNTTMTADVRATALSAAPLAAYTNYAARELPVLYEPLNATTNEYSKSLKSLSVRGVSAFQQNPMGDFMPEYFSF